MADAEQDHQQPQTEPELDDEIARLEAEIEALRAERDEMQQRMMRALADAENARKRAEKDRQEATQYGGSRIARDMLPVYDNLQRALGAVNDEDRAAAAALIEGVELTLHEFLQTLERHGVSRVSPEKGETFDPQLHEAMFEAAVPDVPHGGVIQVMNDGFLLHDRLLRPAKVGVSSRSESQPQEE